MLGTVIQKSVTLNQNDNPLVVISYKRERGNTYITIQSDILPVWYEQIPLGTTSVTGSDDRFYTPTRAIENLYKDMDVRFVHNIKTLMLDDIDYNVLPLFSSKLKEGFTFIVKTPIAYDKLKICVNMLLEVSRRIFVTFISDKQGKRVLMLDKAGDTNE